MVKNTHKCIIIYAVKKEPNMKKFSGDETEERKDK